MGNPKFFWQLCLVLGQAPTTFPGGKGKKISTKDIKNSTQKYPQNYIAVYIFSGMGFALLAHVPAITGIYMAFYQNLIYTIFATSRHNSMG